MQKILRGVEPDGGVPPVVSFYLACQQRKRLRALLGFTRGEVGALPVSVADELDEIGCAIRDYERHQAERGSEL